jgi:hypothetical protein
MNRINPFLKQEPKKKQTFEDWWRSTWKIWRVPKKIKIRKSHERISYRQPEGYCEEPLTKDGHKKSWKDRGLSHEIKK